MINKYVFLGNCLYDGKSKDKMLKYIQGRFKPGSEDNFINGLLGEYVAEAFLKSMKICNDLHVNEKQDYIYSIADPHQYLESEPDFWNGEIGYDVKSTRKASFAPNDKQRVIKKAKEEGARLVVLLTNFDYHQSFGEAATLTIVDADDGHTVLDGVKIPDEFILHCFKNLMIIALKEDLAHGKGLE